MKKFYLFFVLAVFCTVTAYSQKYAASEMITNGNKTTCKVAYLDATTPSKQAETVAENLVIIWQKSETYAIGNNSYYSKLTDRSFINWATNDKRVAQYANTNTAIWEFPTHADFPQSFSNKDGNMYIVADGTELYVLDPTSGEEVWHKSFSLPVSYAAAFPDGNGFYCSVGEYPGTYTVYCFLVNSHTPVWSFEAENGVVGISVPEDHSQVLVCLGQPATKALVVNPADGEIVQDLYYYNNSPTQSPAFSANGEYLAVADFSGKGTLYKRINGKYEKQWYASLQSEGTTSVWGCGQAISADGSTIAFGTLDFTTSGFDGSVYVFNNYSNEPLWEFHGCGDRVASISITDDGSLLGCASWGPMNNSKPDLYIFRKESSEPVATLNTPGSLFFVDIATDGSRGVTAGKGVHAGEMGWGGNAYFFKPVPETYGNISGNVNLIGADDHSFALLTLENIDNYYAFSNIEGDFNIKYIPAGTYTLTATKQGYYSKTVEDIVVIGENTTDVAIELEPAGTAVQNLFATQGAYSTVNLSWKQYEGTHTGFNIYRKLNENAPFKNIISTTGANAKEFIDNTALPTIHYYYAVTAIISDGLESPFSNTVLGFVSTSFITKEIDIYSSEIIPTIDGVISPGEWDDAFVFDVSDFLGSDGTFQPVGSVIMYVKADPSIVTGPYLYVAVENKNDTQLSSGDRTAFYIDDNNNGVYEPPGDDSEGNYWINYGPGGNYSIQYRPIYNTGGVGTVVNLPPTVAASDATGYVVAEFKLPIGAGDSDITPGPGNKSKAYIYVRDGAFGNQDGQWPFDNPETFNPIGYGTMNFFTTLAVPPPPTNLRYLPYYFNSPEFVAISWDIPKINNLSHFIVSITNENSDALVIETFETTGNQLIYNVEDLAKYHVTITTVDKAGQESEPSELLEINTDFTGIVVVNKTLFKIYPNPATEVLIVETEIIKEIQVEIYNISGIRVGAHLIKDNLSSINISKLTSGIYFIKVGNSVQKFVKY
jgi:fibronectin type 3 domain-containing protein